MIYPRKKDVLIKLLKAEGKFSVEDENEEFKRGRVIQSNVKDLEPNQIVWFLINGAYKFKEYYIVNDDSIKLYESKSK